METDPVNSGFLGSVVRNAITGILSSAGMAAYVNQNDAVAIATGAGALASFGWSVYSHWGMKKVPVKAIVVDPPEVK